MVPMRERSLDIFGNEKFLDLRVKGSSLFSGRLSLAVIGAERVDMPSAIHKPHLSSPWVTDYRGISGEQFHGSSAS